MRLCGTDPCTHAGGGDQPNDFSALGLGHGALGHALKAGSEILADLAGHEAEFPAGAVIHPAPLVGQELVARDQGV